MLKDVFASYSPVGLNSAVQERDVVISMVALEFRPALLQSPVHPNKNEALSSGTASSMTVVPSAYDSRQSEGQSIPESVVERTVPEPEPVMSTVSANWVKSNTAVQLRAWLMVTVAVSPLAVQSPVQPVNVDAFAGSATRVTVVPAE